ncbi:MAG: hypothetical protein U0325_17200 [Polyangiales bacterium]
MFPLGAPGLRTLLLGPSSALPMAHLAPSGALTDACLTLAVVLVPQAATALLGAWRVASDDPLWG